MDELLLKIMQHMAAAMPELTLVDEYYGQLETQDDTYPVTFPCVLVGDMTGDWKDLGYSGVQEGTVTLTVRLAIDCYDDTHIGSTQEGAITERQQMARKLYKALQMQRFVKDMGPLSRIKSQDYTIAHGIKVYEQIYQFEYHDMSAMV
jgi:hypothetical protein